MERLQPVEQRTEHRRFVSGEAGLGVEAAGPAAEPATRREGPQPGIQLPDPPIHTGQNYNGLNIWHWDWGTIPVTEEQTEDAQTIAWATHFLSTTTASHRVPTSSFSYT